MTPADCLKTRPKIVALVGLGASRLAYGEQVCAEGCKRMWDEVWGVNFGVSIYKHDKLWVMDDLRVQAERLPSYGDALRQHDRPIITSTPYPEFPMSVKFPLEETLTALGDDFLNSTVAYAIAYALTTGVKELWLYGCNFHYPNQTRAEEGGQCAAYLLGLGRHFGMTFRIPGGTTLLGAYHAILVGEGMRRPLYGYAKQPFIPEEKTDGAQSPRSSPDGKDRGDHGVPSSEGPPDRIVAPGPGTADLDTRRGDLLGERGGSQEPAGVVLGGLPKDDGGAPVPVGHPPA